jgi:hypothetical protein
MMREKRSLFYWPINFKIVSKKNLVYRRQLLLVLFYLLNSQFLISSTDFFLEQSEH